MQRSFTKRLPGLGNLTSSERLIKLKIQSLEHRRLVADLVTCFNIIHGFSSLKFSDFFQFSNSNRTSGHNLRLEIPLVNSSIRYNFFANRVIKPWNSLPLNVVNAFSTNSFKIRLASVDLSIFLKYPRIICDN